MTDLADDLAAHMEGDIDTLVEWSANQTAGPALDRSEADRLLRRVRRLEVALADVRALAQDERDRLKEWEDSRAAVIQGEIAMLSHAADGWMRAVEALTGKVTENLPHGTLSLRPGSPSLICSDPAALWQWCAEERREGWVTYRTVYQPAAGDLRHYLKPGAVIGPALDRDGDPMFTDDGSALLDHDAHDPDTGERVPYVVLRLPERKRFKLTTKPRPKETRP